MSRPVALALEAAEALESCMADGTQDKALVHELIATRREGRKMPRPAILPPLAQVAASILDGDGTSDAAQFWLSQRASCTT